LGRRTLIRGKNKMKEKEIIVDALELGIALARIYLDKINYLYEQHLEDGDDEKETEYFIKKIETKSKIETLKKLQEQYK
jgi:hypothetical protein